MIIITTTLYDALKEYKYHHTTEANKVPIESVNETVELKTANDVDDDHTAENVEAEDAETTEVSNIRLSNVQVSQKQVGQQQYERKFKATRGCLNAEIYISC